MDTSIDDLTRQCSQPRGQALRVVVLITQAAAFALGAWKGYGFGALIGGTPLGVVLALNLGVMAAVAVGTVANWLRRPPRG